MKNTQDVIPALLGNSRCNYLGVKDDPQTCLAFPSNWNYCQRARPPESVGLDYQRLYCQTTDFVDCLIYQNVKISSLPPDIRGRKDKNKGYDKSAIRILLLLPILAILLILLWLGKSSILSTGVGTNIYSNTIEGNLASSSNPLHSPTPEVNRQNLPVIVTPLVLGVFPTWTSLSLTYVSSVSTAASFTRNLSSVTLCGYKLDIPFGQEIKFSIHQAQGGDSLNKYAESYDTSVEAIQAVNYRLPIPLRKDWVVVIPHYTKRVPGVPAFEPYLITDSNISIGSLAQKLSTDPEALKKYNGLSENCPALSGWVLIPHKKLSP